MAKITKKKNTSSKLNKKSKRIPIKKGQWSSEEDKLLLEWVKKNGTKDWEACGRFVQGRKGKQCREHWNNCLSPGLVKGEWTEEEDFLIMFFYEKCNGSWKKIIPLFNGRIENDIKNRFYSQLRKHATKNMNPKERRRLCPKIKLNELKNYLNEALNEAKTYFLKKSKMNQEQFNLFIKKNEQKIKEIKDTIIPEESENLESNLSTNYIGSSIEEDTTKKISDEKKSNINGVQEEPEKNIEVILPLENNDDIFQTNINNSNFDGIVEFNDNYLTKNIYENINLNINTYSNDIISINSYHKDNYNISFLSEINNDNNRFCNNSLMNIFKENNYNYNYSDNKTLKSNSNFGENLESIYKLDIF
jgi:hypothetical protein